jgi:hypothetical protein
MIMDTAKLIEQLSKSAAPVRPLSRAWIRAAVWLMLSVPYIALVVIVVSPRSDLMVKLTELRYVIEQFAALATGITAAIAAFAATIPGYNRKILLLPVFPLALWLGSLGQGCLQTWLRFGTSGLTLQPDLFCFPAVALVGMLPAIVIAVMLRRGAPLAPCITAGLGGLAAAGLGNFGLRLFHPQDASLMVLVWQVGTVFVLMILAGCAGRYVLNWHSLVDPVRRALAVG